MPPIRTGSSPKSTNQEGKILLALNDIKNGRIKSIHAAAKLYEIPYTTLYTLFKYAYSRFVSDLICVEYNHIDKFDFLDNYQHIPLEVFQSTNPTIKNSFAASGLVPLDPERVLRKLNILLQTLSPPGSRPNSRSSEFTPQTPKTATQLFKQASMLKDLLKQRSNSPPSPSKEMLDQIIKECALALHSSALLAKENADYHTANEKKRQKRNRSTRQIPCEEGLTVEEGLQLGQQLKSLDEAIQVDSHTQSELPNQAAVSATRAPPRCSGCREIGHKINACKNRYI
ncbi:uncharacterized protein N7469_004054 [Penicillium citrinum]|uniref:HTH psq-type domain-containing protein n=1 Tax=Penicillium citrinum TaxID=5077 RepID=A0A9W9P3Q3_PENCI|nr:uncharacterized protein N7469_004054 [Penicillium citrinum]KAJ5234886.1 hypothetical protein N7469_004054 [Penicillium citrinum]